jgi:hypothetical protein
MEINSITKATLAYHQAAKELDSVLDQAVADRRFKLRLDEARKFRDLVDDAEKLGNRAWRKSLKVPIELKVAAGIKN